MLDCVVECRDDAGAGDGMVVDDGDDDGRVARRSIVLLQEWGWIGAEPVSCCEGI